MEKKRLKKLSLSNFSQWPADRISHAVLIAAISLAVLVFAGFFLIGYDMPFEEDANFNAPLLTDAVFYLMYLLLAGALGVCLWALYRGLRRGDFRRKADDNGVPSSRIVWGTVGLLFGSLILTFIFGSSQPIKINGADYTDTFWLKATDMFVNTSIILTLVAVGAVVYGLSGRNRREHGKTGKGAEQ